MAMIDNIEELKELSGLMTPELIRFMELSKETGPVIPIKADKFIFLGEAAEILGTNKTVICRYVREGLLKAWYIPHNPKRKFKLSEVLALAKEEVIV
ncbi:MAG: hypothetical protein IJ712_05575 [Anaerovibrio sp.]|nr:hypothetical protein [Anaerovibrio sp.]